MTEVTAPTKRDIRTKRDVIYQAIVDLCSAGRPANRRTISNATRLPLRIVDDHIKRMKEDGLLQALDRSDVALVKPEAEDRAISTTFLQCGSLKVELGDEIIVLSMREARTMGIALAGTILVLGR